MNRKPYSPPVIERNQERIGGKYGAGRSAPVCERIGGVAVEQLARDHGSPLFVMVETELRERLRSARRAFGRRYPDVRFAWSYKTNYLQAVCSVFHQEGAIAEVVSDFEYDKARALGIAGEDIIVNGPCKTPELLRRAAAEGAMIHIDHLDELLALERIAAELDQSLNVAIRINMDTGIVPAWSKFGFNYESGEAQRTIRRLHRGGRLALTGLHAHIGTFVLEPHCYQVATSKMVDLALTARREFDCEIRYLDIGGGFPSRNTLHYQYYPSEQVVPSLDRYAEAICDTLLEQWPASAPRPTLYVEAGRALVDEAGYLITTVLTAKRTPQGRRAIVLDAGVNLLYVAAWYRLQTMITRPMGGGSSDTMVYGPLCMNIDVLRDHARLPALEAGERLVLHPVGAYNLTQSMQFITYRPRVVLVGPGGRVDLIREREDLAYVEAMERLPERLQPGSPAA